MKKAGLFFSVSIQLSCALLILLVVASSLSGAPFAKRIQFRQPDGTVTQLWGQGDEFYAVFETLDGYTVVFDPAQRAYCYASLSADGNQLLSTGVQVQAATPQSLGLPAHRRLSPQAVRRQIAARYAQWDAAMQVSERWTALKAANRDGSFGPPSTTTIGTKVGLTMLIDFSDDPATLSQTNIANFCNGDNYSSFGNNGSVKAYYYYNSNGRLTYSNMVTLYVRAPHPKTYYNDITVDAGLEGRKLIGDALAAMKNLPNYATDFLPLFDALTTDNQNRVVAFNVFYAGDNGGVWSMGLWPHSWSLASPVELSPGGKKVYNYQISNIGAQLEIGTFCHENGHMLCGYPDLYDYTGDSAGVGDWCLMAGGSWGGSGSNPGNNPSQICAYLKRAAGWATTVELTTASSGVATVSAAPGTNFNLFYRFAKPGMATEYYLAECRFNANHDASLPGSGVAIWHIDELGDNSTVNLNPNSQHDNYEATLVQADNRWDLEQNRNGGEARDLYYRGNPAAGYTNQLTDSTGPKAAWWNGSRSGLVFRDFSAAAQTMTFAIGTNPPVPILVTQPASQTVLQGMPAAFSVSVSGLPPFGYQWSHENARIAGATSSSYLLSSAQPTDAGGYSVVVTNAYGSLTSAVATLTIIPTVPLAVALNNNTLTWTTDTNQPWYGQTNLSHDGVASARSYFIGAGQQTSLKTTVNGPGILTFWWTISSSDAANTLSFSSSAPGSHTLQLAGTVDWAQQLVYLPAGSQTLQWTYATSAGSGAVGDVALVDQVSYSPGASQPFITTQPVSRFITVAVPAVFSVTADGTPTLTYQWRFNGRDITGATDGVLTIPRPQAADAGRYSVLVANAYGQVLSSDAALGMVPLAAIGDDSLGQLEVPGSATNAVAVAAGSWHNLALRADGRVLAWGENYAGQCDVPAGLANVASVAAGGYHSLARRLDNSVLGWGANDYGQATTPPGLSQAVAVAAGLWHSLALRSDGTVVAWGDDTFGQANVPAGLPRVAAIAAGGNHNLALLTNGTVVAWGENTDATGNFCGQSIVPQGLTNVVAIAAGQYHSLAALADGRVVAWGDDSQGQSQVPADATNIVALAGGGAHSLALKADGTAIAWGNDWYGQASVPAGLTNIIQLAAGDSHSLLLVGIPPFQPLLLNPVYVGNRFSVTLQTLPGKNYTLEATTALGAPNWTAVDTVPGDGDLQVLTDPAASGPQRLYRVRQW